jgi:hypothetical protein
MFVPVIEVPSGVLQYVNIEAVRRIEQMENMTPEEAPPVDGEPQHTQPDGQPWATTWLHFTEHDGMRVKGAPIQLMTQWFGAPANAQRPPSRQQRRAQEREQSRIVKPGHPSGLPIIKS